VEFTASLSSYPTVTMDAVPSSETLVSLYQTTWNHLS